jgi:hypothetical protein
VVRSGYGLPFWLRQITSPPDAFAIAVESPLEMVVVHGSDV